MIKYYCNHCGTETDNTRQRLIKLEHLDKGVHLCGECFAIYNKLQLEHDTNIAKYTKEQDKIIKDFLNIK